MPLMTILPFTFHLNIYSMYRVVQVDVVYTDKRKNDFLLYFEFELPCTCKVNTWYKSDNLTEQKYLNYLSYESISTNEYSNIRKCS